MINNDPILWTMLNAIKEQNAEIEQLKEQNKEIAQLKEQLARLQGQMAPQTANRNLPRGRVTAKAGR